MSLVQTSDHSVTSVASVSTTTSVVLQNNSQIILSTTNSSCPALAQVDSNSTQQKQTLSDKSQDCVSSILLQEDVAVRKRKTSHTRSTNNPPNNSALVGPYMELQSIHPVVKSFLVGSLSGTCSTVLFQPLDLLKTRLQTPTIGHEGGGLLNIVGNIVRNEKLMGLWKGMTPSLTRCVPGVGLYFATIHTLKSVFDIKGEPTAFQSVFLGVTGRSFSGVMMIPFTVVKTRFESKVYHYSSIREALSQIYGKEGVRGLTCGLLPTLLRDAPFSGLYLLMYTTTKQFVPKELKDSNALSPYIRFSCGVIAGIGASLVTQPADVIKTKMQLFPNKFNNIPQVMIYVYEKYGAQGYFKGLMPRMVRRTLVAAMSWTVYEQLMESIGLK